jgi:hypothetical protein
MEMSIVVGLSDFQRMEVQLEMLPTWKNSQVIFDIQPNPDGARLLPPGEPERIQIYRVNGGVNIRWDPAERARDYIVIRKRFDTDTFRWELVQETIEFTPLCQMTLERQTWRQDSNQYWLYRVIARNESGWTFSDPVLAPTEPDSMGSEFLSTIIDLWNSLVSV